MRYRQYLRARYRAILASLGGLLFIMALTILSPLIILPFYPEEFDYAPVFVLTALPIAILAWLLNRLVNLREVESLSLQEGRVLIVIAWVLAVFLGAIPLFFVKDLNFSQAIFESTSAWTTTGLSVVNVSEAPKIILLYRSILQLVGGAGFAIIMLSSLTGPSGSGLAEAEGRDDQLVPHVRSSATIVLRMYVAYCVLGTLALIFAGMSPFDAVNHAFAALSTGGFSTHPESIAYWDSVAIEAVIIVLMVLGTLNFLTVWVLIQGKWRAFLRNGEIRLMAIVIPIGTFLLFWGTTASIYPNLEKAIRVAIFEFISAISTTGFSTVSYSNWSAFGILLMIIAMLMGGGSGSTAGGIKQFRIYILFKGLRWEIYKAFLPEHSVNMPVAWKGEQRGIISDKQIRQAAIFVFFYMLLFFGIVLLVLAHGSYSLDAAMFETASAISTIGLSVGLVTPDSPASLLWLLSFGMLLGRLEFFAFFIGFIKLASDSKDLFFLRDA